MTRLTYLLRICKFITDTKGRACTFSHQQIALPEPGHILIVNIRIPHTLLHQIQMRASDMLSQYDICLLHILYQTPVKVCIHSSTPDGPGKINLLHSLTITIQI